MANLFGNYKEISDAAVRFIERYSTEAIRNVSAKRRLPTQCHSLNHLLNGGIATQEITEVIGENHMHNGNFIVDLLVHQLYREPQAEAVIISSNGTQNDDAIYRIACRYVEQHGNADPSGTSNILDDAVFEIMRRIFIVRCTDIKELMVILDMVSEGAYRNRRESFQPHERSSQPSLNHNMANDEHVSSSNAFEYQKQPTEMTAAPTDRQSPGAGELKTQISIVAIHMLTSMVEDSNFYDAWQLTPAVCSKLRSIAAKMNVAVIVSNFEGEAIASAGSVSEELDESDVRRKRIVGWFMSSTRWNSTVDKRLEVAVRRPERNAEKARFTVELTKSRYSPVGGTCELELSEQGLCDAKG